MGVFILNEKVNKYCVESIAKFINLHQEERDKEGEHYEEWRRYKIGLMDKIHREIERRCKWALSEYGYKKAMEEVSEELGIKILSFQEWVEGNNART